ncbi:MAG: hypothetical protein JEZ04_01045 [Spirochaetales bacterium]|nr:hypothetical protein [Spirochaetales bacterium]
MKDHTADYIWTGAVLPDKDRKVCFRKKLSAGEGIDKLSVEIWADSRYYLWIGGAYIGTGPARCWPEYPEKDVWEIEPGGAAAATGEVLIAVLIWHFGTSTSQYIHGPAGFFASIRAECPSGRQLFEVSDKSWRCSIQSGYQSPVPRINVSQGWLEVFDSRLFPSEWMQIGFDDSLWPNAIRLPSPMTPNGHPLGFEEMPVLSIPNLASHKRQPLEILQRQRTLCRGIGVRIDYKESFYPDDRTTEDRLQSGYICALISSCVDQDVIFTLADRCWPAVDEYIILRGEMFTIKPGCDELKLRFNRGDNLLLLDVSGAKQRFSADFHLRSEQEIVFSPVLEDSSSLFAAAGPFKTIVIGNIVCNDGFDFKIGGDDYDRVALSPDVEDLRLFSTWLSPVPNALIDGVKLRNIGADRKLISNRRETCCLPLVLEPTETDGDYEVIIDMGVEVSGFIHFSIDAGAEAEIDIRFFEYLSEGIPEIPEDLDTSMRYICSEGRLSYYSLLRRGFRYMAIRLRSSAPLIINSLEVDERLYPLKRRAMMNTGDPLLDKIWRMCRRTVELCSEDTPVDSPAFEQAFWTGDAYVMALYLQYLSGDTDLIRRSLLLAARSMRYSPLPDCHLPAGVHLLLTAWAQLWLLAVYDYWIHTADRAFIVELLPWLEKAGDAFVSLIGENGLFKVDAWNMLDWAGMDTPYKGIVAHLNARLVECLKRLAELAVIAGAEGGKTLWKRKADELAVVTDAAFWNSDRGCYIDSIHDDGVRSDVVSVQTNLMMLIYGCVPEGRQKAVKNFVFNPPPGAVLPGSPFLAHFYYEFLFREGMGKKAVAGIRKQWEPMLQHGTCWETFIGFYKERLTRSYCHAWSSAPAYLFGAYILGVRPAEPGFRKILISPNTSGLTSASGLVPMPHGDAQINWTVDGGRFICRAVLPAETTWSFIPPPEFPESSEIIVEFRQNEES